MCNINNMTTCNNNWLLHSTVLLLMLTVRYQREGFYGSEQKASRTLGFDVGGNEVGLRFIWMGHGMMRNLNKGCKIFINKIHAPGCRR